MQSIDRFGLSCALALPFKNDFTIDHGRLAAQARWCLNAGCSSVTVFGTTGEGASVSLAERGEVLGALLSVGIEPGQQLVELVGAECDHRGQPDRGVHRVPAADPVPEPEHVRRVDAERGHPLGVRGHRDEVVRDRVRRPERVDDPVPGGGRVGQRLQRPERLGGDDEEGFLGAEVPDRLREVGGIDIRYETEGHFTRAVKLERLIGHNGPEIRSADAYIDDVLYRLACVALEFT